MESRLFGIPIVWFCVAKLKISMLEMNNLLFVQAKRSWRFWTAWAMPYFAELLQSEELWYNIMKTEDWTVSVDYHLTKNLALSYVNQRVYKTTSRFSFIYHIIVKIEDNIFLQSYVLSNTFRQWTK